MVSQVSGRFDYKRPSPSAAGLILWIYIQHVSSMTIMVMNQELVTQEILISKLEMLTMKQKVSCVTLGNFEMLNDIYSLHRY